MLKNYNRVTIYQMLSVIALISFIISASISTTIYPPTTTSKIFVTLGYLPLCLEGIISMINPSLALEAFKAFKNKDREKNLKSQRRLGFIWILLAGVWIFNTWR